MTAVPGAVEESTLRALDYPAVIATVAGYCTCAPGKAAIASLEPALTDPTWAEREQLLVDDAAAFVQAGTDVAFQGVVDTRALAERAEKGSTLSGSDLRHIALAEGALRTAAASLTAERSTARPLHAIAASRTALDQICANIERCIAEDGSVADAASSQLSSIRRQQQALHEQVRERCRAITHNPELASMLSEPIVTVRSGRYVVPVRSEMASQFPGVVHDQSASGATVYIEPMASVEANNKLRTLGAAEEREVLRILTELSRQAGGDAQALTANAALLAQLDSIFARARWAIALRAHRPDFNETPSLRIVQGRHPLLRREAVPLDFDLGEDFDAIIISGPNMGGKTVVLKTVGLFCLLAYAGIPLPAAAGTSIGRLHSIACIIGDEQSIANDLSSFSAHLRALSSATAAAANGSLILVDEIGSGTEPGAGAALAQACIESMIRAGAKVAVTTHFTQLKTFAAAHNRVRNGSMLFDAATNAPTYQFVQGVPGQSFAFSLARAIDLDWRVIARAEVLLGVDAANLERVFAELAAERSSLEAKQAELDALQTRMQRLQDGARQKLAALDEERAAFEKRAAAALQKAVEDLRQELAQRAQARGETAKKQAARADPDSDRALAQTLSEMRRSLGLEVDTSAHGQKRDRPAFASGDSVYVGSFEKNGVVSQVYDDDLLVMIGNVKTLVPASAVTRQALSAAQKLADQSGSTSGLGSLEPRATTSVDVRGMRVDEAWPLVDKALDDASLAGTGELRVVHGKGTGRLGQGLRQFLADHPSVDSVSFAPDREGGNGVSLIKLR
ncbi:MAG: hypothetical protein DLM53_07730 [Candidatus Eremiobacter antarcticus]|nr:Smr/MutS family protein [Candidatus Eremiobacteraeota bacterium]PZR61855.1 MAG: hypothetical protein DLM53_07730 [Candidatus Eremiobacter sp. RRmetagenome_bin22]